jgi:hypothetical protein
MVAANSGNLAEVHAALGAEASVGQLLVVNTAEPTGVEAARKAHLKIVAGGRGVKGSRGARIRQRRGFGV